MSAPPRTTQSLIDALVREAAAATPAEAIRIKARELLDIHVDTFGEPTAPIDVDVLAGLRGIRISEERPFHSQDAELSPDNAGGVTMRINPDRPETRRRFSIAHEISHTFFPDYTMKEWCRTDARYRNRNNPDEHLEMLCDIGAAELLFPAPWFTRDAAAVANASGFIRLAADYRASREATLRRYAETSPDPLAVTFFSWKLKPTQKGIIGNPAQTNLFGISPEDEVRDAIRLRIEYAVPSVSFTSAGFFLPKDKSVDNDGPIYRAASTGQPVDDECHLDLGQASGTYRIAVVPLWTSREDMGASGEHTVAAVLRPLAVRPSKKRRTVQAGSSLFDAS